MFGKLVFMIIRLGGEFNNIVKVWKGLFSIKVW